jgi:PKD repeat protein
MAIVACLLAAIPALAADDENCDPDCGGGEPTNTAPTVEVSGNVAEPHRGQVVTFTAVGFDADDDPLTYAWDLDDGESFDDGTGTTASKSFSTLGTHTVRVRVSDGTATRIATTTVNVVNRAPVASFSRNPTSPKTLETVTFTSTSSDPDGDAVTPRWDLDNDQVFGEAGEVGASVSRSYSTAGAYPVRLIVKDSNGLDSATTIVDVPVANRAPAPSFSVFPGSPSTGEVVTFDSTLTSDPDGTVTSRAWELDGDDDFNDGAGTTATRTFALPGTYEIKLRATDNLSATAVKSTTVTVANRLPVASFSTSPAGPLTGDTVQFDASASSDPEAALAKYEWDLDNDGSYERDTGTTPNTTQAFPAAGTYTTRLRVTDAHGGQATTIRTVTVTQRPADTGGGGTGGGTGGGGTTTDTLAPAWSFAAKKQRSARTKVVVFKLQPNEGCSLSVTAMLGKKRLGTLSKALVANVLVTQKLKLTRKGLGALRKALRTRKAVTITLVTSCADAAGNATTARKTVKVTR